MQLKIVTNAKFTTAFAFSNALASLKAIFQYEERSMQSGLGWQKKTAQLLQWLWILRRAIVLLIITIITIITLLHSCKRQIITIMISILLAIFTILILPEEGNGNVGQVEKLSKWSHGLEDLVEPSGPVVKSNRKCNMLQRYLISKRKKLPARP